MAFSTLHRYNGEINGIHIKDIKLDYTKETLKERLDEVLRIIDETSVDGEGVFEKYIDEHYIVSLSKSDETSLNHEVFRKAEQLANYLLGSKEVREDKQTTQYKFYSSEEEFNKRTKKENSLDERTNSKQDVDDIIHFLLAYKGNHKKEKTKTLTRVDSIKNKNTGKYEDVSIKKFLKESKNEYAKEVIKSYLDLYDKIEKILKGEATIDNPKLNRFILSRTMKGLERDMIDSHDMLCGTFGQVLRNPIQDSTVINWDALDLTNPKHIRPLLFINKKVIMPDDDLALIVYDLNQVIKKMYNEHKEYKEKTGMSKRGMLTKSHITIISLVRQGYSIDEVSDILGTTQDNISHGLDKIALNIANYNKKNYKS